MFNTAVVPKGISLGKQPKPVKGTLVKGTARTGVGQTVASAGFHLGNGLFGAHNPQGIIPPAVGVISPTIAGMANAPTASSGPVQIATYYSQMTGGHAVPVEGVPLSDFPESD